MERQDLERAVGAGMTLRQLAAEFECSVSTVRHWLRVHGLKTAGRRTRVISEAQGRLMSECRTHGLTEFVLEGRGYYRCKRCRSEQVSARRRRVKATLVQEAGGCCRLCGYDRYVGALEFHHLDPTQKAFMLSRQGATRSIAEAREEAQKCILVCANCHAELESGIAKAPEAA